MKGVVQLGPKPISANKKAEFCNSRKSCSRIVLVFKYPFLSRRLSVGSQFNEEADNFFKVVNNTLTDDELKEVPRDRSSSPSPAKQQQSRGRKPNRSPDVTGKTVAQDHPPRGPLGSQAAAPQAAGTGTTA